MKECPWRRGLRRVELLQAMAEYRPSRPSWYPRTLAEVEAMRGRYNAAAAAAMGRASANVPEFIRKRIVGWNPFHFGAREWEWLMEGTNGPFPFLQRAQLLGGGLRIVFTWDYETATGTSHVEPSSRR